ncbi:MAG: CocE/NonD family hydrolase [Thermodesulfobacteriota bacterium]
MSTQQSWKLPSVGVAVVVVLTTLLLIGSQIAIADHEASQVQYGVVKEENVEIQMRDGTIIRADVYRPDAEGQFPVLVARTPYNKETASSIRAGTHLFFPPRGYVFVIVDTRGRYASDGEFAPFLDDGWGANRDGYDAIEWTAEQEWSNGKVGIVGGSYAGATAYLTLPTQPPHLVAAFIRESSADYYTEWIYRGGAYEMWNQPYAGIFSASILDHKVAAGELGMDEAEALKAQIATAWTDDRSNWFWNLPVNQYPAAIGVPGHEWYADWVNNPNDGPYWWQIDSTLKPNQINVPVYHLGALYDIFFAGTLKNYMGVQHTGLPGARGNQKMVVGPWVHGPTNIGLTEVGDLVFPGADEVQYNQIRLRWFDHWMKGLHTGIMDEPAVKIYTMGVNEWRYFSDWPPPEAQYTNFYLRSGTSGSINSINDGVLGTETPTEAENPDSFLYDPMNPVPTLGGNNLFMVNGPRDHREADAISLTYTSPVLQEDLQVSGPIKAVLYAMSSAVDTDWTVRLTDVSPDGTSINVADGIIRARYRESLTNPTLIEPDQVYQYEVDLWSTSNVFKAGHRIRVSIHSSNFPKYNRNLNVAEHPNFATEMETALNTIFHDVLRPSHIILPVIPEM